MGTNNKKKALKNIKGLDKAHPYSRKANQMKRVLVLEQHAAQKDKERAEPKKRLVDKLLWFKDNNDKVATTEEMHDLIQNYIDRNIVEINELKKSWRPNRPKPAKLAALELIRTGELEQYKVGFEIPDLREKKVFDILQNFDGDHHQVSRISLIRLKKV